MRSFFSLVALVLSLTAFSQQTSSYTAKLPAGYKIADVNNKETRFESDLDKDGIMDLAVILSKKDDNSAILAIFLSSNFKKDKSYQRLQWFHMINDFEVKNNILTVDGTDMGKYLTEIKMKYDPVSKKMKITSGTQSGLEGHDKKLKLKLSDAKL